MQASGDLKEIKKKVYLSYFQDGIWDILLGAYLLGWAFSVIFDFVAVTGGLWVATYFIALGLKKRVVYPRTGYIKIKESRKLQMRMMLLGVLVFFAGITLFLLFTVGDRPQWAVDYFMLILGTLMSLTVAAMGYWWRVSRWYIYAVIMFIGFILHQWTGTPLEYSFFVPGGIVIITGIVFFTRFLRRYPKSTLEDIDVIS